MANLLKSGGFQGDRQARRWTSAAGMSAFAILVIGAFVGLMILDLTRMRADAFRASERNTAALAALLADNMRQTVASVDQVEQEFTSRLDGRADRSFKAMGAVRQELIVRLMSIPEVQVFSVFDADGKQLLALSNWPARTTDGSDRDYFTAHRDNPNLGLVVSKVFYAPATDRDVISIARRLNNADGSFAGVFAVSIVPGYLQRIYDQAGINRNGSLALYRDDGTMLVRHPRVRELTNKSFAGSALFSVHLKESPVGTIETVSAIDGVRRMTSYRRVEGAPLVVAVSEAYDEILSSWQDLVGRYIALAILIALAVGGFSFAVHRQTANRVVSDGRFRAAVDSTSNAFFALNSASGPESDLAFTITDANVAAGALLGIDRQSLVGKSLAAVAPGFCGNGVLPICAEAREAGLPRDTQVTFVPMGAGERWFRVRATPFAGGIALAMRDVTEEWEAREALKAAKDSAESANRTKSEFLANMSHELRTPLNAIIGFSESLQRGLFGGLTDKQHEYVHDIHGAGQHLLAIINDVLDLSRIESGKAALFEEDVDLESLALSAIRMVRPRAEEKRLAIALEGVRGLPSVRADSMRLQQVLLNLLSNAVKFTPEGGSAAVTGAIDADGNIRLAVTDTGIGIAVSDIPKVLMPFELVESAFARKYKGTGLGLPLAKRLVEMHGGAFKIESAPGQGTTVVILLPASRIVRPPIAQAG
jgi:two-component system, sensor histidine kinase and response regulator